MAMGKRDTLDRFTSEKLHLHKIPLNAQGYERDGTYWGVGKTLWCASNANGDRRYVRADTRILAKLPFPCATFYR